VAGDRRDRDDAAAGLAPRCVAICIYRMTSESMAGSSDSTALVYDS
jgi:hypothetical protein